MSAFSGMNHRDLMTYPVSRMTLWQVNGTEVDPVKRPSTPSPSFLGKTPVAMSS